MELKELCGKHILSGIETGYVEEDEMACGYIKFCLDGIVYMAIEDPDDGWRSYCRELIVSDMPCDIALPDVEVFGVMQDGSLSRNDVLRLFDTTTAEEVLAVGTEDWDGWYPCCVMRWTPENLSCNVERKKENEK